MKKKNDDYVYEESIPLNKHSSKNTQQTPFNHSPTLFSKIKEIFNENNSMQFII
jgi:hypothetical protein